MSDMLPAPLPAPISAAHQSHILNIVRRAARAEILPRFRNLHASDIDSKSGPDDLVTAADVETEKMMTRALTIAFPTALIVGEEAASKDPELVAKIDDAPLCFILDPVDGTWHFANGLAMFGVILAVTQYGKPVFGLIYDPLADDWAVANAEGPATFERASGMTRPLHAAMGKALEELTGFVPQHLWQGETRQKLAQVATTFRRTRSLGCAAHEYRMVAQGKIDFAINTQLKPWDHVAGALICERAGAHVEMLDGTPYTAGRSDGVLMVAPDRTTWNRLQKVLSFLVDG